jgi:PAS domain-containing protein
MSSRLSSELLSSIIGDIYDCAIDPSGWSGVLSRITAAVDAAYTTIALSNPVGQVGRMAAQSPWDPEQLRILNEEYGVDGVPGLKRVLFNDVDEAWSTLTNMKEAEFQQTPFYQNWARPQGLRDACLVKFVHTADRIGILGCITRESRDIIGPAEQAFVALLSPHLRRAAMIGDLLDHARVDLQLYQQTLNQLSVPVILTNDAAQIQFANAAAKQMFQQSGPILQINKQLRIQNILAEGA